MYEKLLALGDGGVFYKTCIFEVTKSEIDYIHQGVIHTKDMTLSYDYYDYSKLHTCEADALIQYINTSKKAIDKMLIVRDNLNILIKEGRKKGLVAKSIGVHKDDVCVGDILYEPVPFRKGYFINEVVKILPKDMGFLTNRDNYPASFSDYCKDEYSAMCEGRNECDTWLRKYRSTIKSAEKRLKIIKEKKC